MYELEFKELETFETPEGKNYEVYPLRVEDMKLVYKFIEFNQERLGKFIKKDNEEFLEEDIKKIGNEVLYNDLIPICNEIIDKSVMEIGTGELLPHKYRTIQIVMELAAKAIIATTGNTKKSNGRDIPLEQQQNPSNSSEGMSTPSRKKQKKTKKK